MADLVTVADIEEDDVDVPIEVPVEDIVAVVLSVLEFVLVAVWVKVAATEVVDGAVDVSELDAVDAPVFSPHPNSEEAKPKRAIRRNIGIFSPAA